MDIIKFICEKFNISYTFTKFLFVGVLNTIFGYVAFAAFNFTGMHYTLSVFFATVLGILFNFKTTGCLVFNNHDNKLLLKFVLIYCITYVFTVSVLMIFSKFGLENMYINYAMVIPVNVLLSYCLMKRFVFHKLV